jgi:FMN phosphatase YigB (HAD superfamily)
LLPSSARILLFQGWCAAPRRAATLVSELGSPSRVVFGQADRASDRIAQTNVDCPVPNPQVSNSPKIDLPPAAPVQAPPKLVTFDWGGVILRHCRSWAEACQHVGISVREGMDDPELQALRRKINQEFQCGRMSEADFFPAISRATLDLYSPDEVRTIHCGWLLREYHGVADVIESLNNRRGVETALLSNTNAAHWRRHLSTGFKPADFPTIGLIKHKHASHLLGHAKPGVEIYRAFEKAVGMSGSDILFFDDLPENILIARELGWRAELIDHTRETKPQLLDKLALVGL